MEKHLEKSGVMKVVVRAPLSFLARGGPYWLTRPRDPEDYFLADGDNMILPKGTWLVQALGAGILVWTETDEVRFPILRRPQNETPCLSSVSRI